MKKKSTRDPESTPVFEHHQQTLVDEEGKMHQTKEDEDLTQQLQEDATAPLPVKRTP